MESAICIKGFSKAYIIGETAYNHQGDWNYLIKMIDLASDVGLNAIKFHLLLNLDSYFQSKHPLRDTLKQWLFSENQWDSIIKYSLDNELDVIALCDDVESVEFIINSGLGCAIEIHATSLNDYFILNTLSSFSKTIYLGVGGSSIDEISYAIEFLKSRGKKDIVLMYGFQSYPTDYRNINLSKMVKLSNLFDLPVGYGDHTAFNDSNNELLSVLPAAMGFNILEKHFTLDEGEERVDYHAAVGKEKLFRIISMMETALKAYGNNNISMTKPELEYGNTGPMKKAIVARRKICQGHKIDYNDLWFKRTEEESTIKQSDFEKLLGLEAVTDIEKDDIVDFTKVKYVFQVADAKSFTHLEDKSK